MKRASGGLRAAAAAAALAGILMAQVYGCGVSADRYVEEVLEGWSSVEARTEWLARGLDGLAEEGGAERLRLLAGEAARATESFLKDLDRRIPVPGYQRRFNDLLRTFLSDYASYLAGLRDYLDAAVLGAEGEVPDLEGLAARARQSLGDYQDAQEYNGARIDEGVWEMARALPAAARQARPGGGRAPDGEPGPFPVPGPEDALALWYEAFARSDGGAMYDLLSPYSPLLEEYGTDVFAARVEEARASGVEARCLVLGTEAAREEGLDWAVCRVAVDYGGGAPEEFTVELDCVEGLWKVTRVNSPSGIW